MSRFFLLATMILLAAAQAAGLQGAAPKAAPVRVALKTSQGVILIELETRRAPLTSANFLRYAENKKFDGTSFYRAARTKGNPRRGFIQGGVRHSIRRVYPPVAHEPTSKTGLRHVEGTISMARNAPGSAMGDFFITLGPMPAMDARPGRAGDNQGFAAFGRVVGGMDVVRRILAAPTVANAGRGAMKGQMLAAPVRIVAARRVR